MRTTIDIPDPMLRQVKAKCALEGRTMRSLALVFFDDWIRNGAATSTLLASTCPEESQETGLMAAHEPGPAEAAGKHGKSVRLRDLPAFGMWKDREDMADPVAWVREQRKPRFST